MPGCPHCRADGRRGLAPAVSGEKRNESLAGAKFGRGDVVCGGSLLSVVPGRYNKL